MQVFVSFSSKSPTSYCILHFLSGCSYVPSLLQTFYLYSFIHQIYTAPHDLTTEVSIFLSPIQHCCFFFSYFFLRGQGHGGENLKAVCKFQQSRKNYLPLVSIILSHWFGCFDSILIENYFLCELHPLFHLIPFIVCYVQVCPLSASINIFFQVLVQIYISHKYYYLDVFKQQNKHATSTVGQNCSFIHLPFDFFRCHQ